MMTFTFLDWFLLIAIVGTIVYCAVRGFIKSLSGTIRILGAFLLARIFGPMLGKLLASHWIGPRVYEWVDAKMLELFGNLENSLDFGSLYTENADFAALIDRFNAYDKYSEFLESAAVESNSTREELTELVISSITPWVERVSVVISYIIVFIIAFFALFFITKLMAFVVKRIDVLNRTDHMLGAALGVFSGIYTVIGVCIAIETLIGLLVMNSIDAAGLQTVVENSMLFSPIYRLVSKLF